MAYLDHYLKAAQDARLGKQKAIVTGERRKHVISVVMDLLDDFRLSHWEHEGTARAGIRSSLCLLGHDWAPADEEAATLIAVALKKNRAPARPDWDEGQREFTVSPENCKVCFGALTQTQIDRKHRFCSAACATKALRAWDVALSKDSSICRAAYRIIREGRTAARTCEACGERYHPVRKNSDQKVCSTVCRDALLRTRELRPCDLCAKPFLPSLKVNRFCSRVCASEAGRQQRYIKTCEVCDTAFATAMPNAKHCSGKCTAKAHYWRKKAAKSVPAPKPKPKPRSSAEIIYLTPQVFDRCFRTAA